MAKIYGQLEKAQAENTTSDTATMPKGMITYRTDLNLMKVSNGTAYKELIDEDSTQILAGKTLTAPSITGATTYDEIATPSNPSANHYKLYFKSTGTPYYLNSAGTETQIAAATVAPLVSPVFHDFGSGSGTYDIPYYFIITSGNATVGATYTNNGVTYTVYKTVSAATKVVMTGNGAPTTSGTLTKASGTGDATLTFSSAIAPLYLAVKMVGGGGGGAGSSTLAASDGGNGGSGTSTTFGSSLLTSNGGGGGAAAGRATQGGQNTISNPAYGFAIEGARGGCGFLTAASTQPYLGGADGASSPFGGRGDGATAAGVAGFAAIANSGSGGGGGGGNGTADRTGGGGSSGGYIDAIVPAPLSATYAYSIGTGGTAGTAGTSGYAGGAGAAGYVGIWAHYQ